MEYLIALAVIIVILVAFLIFNLGKKGNIKSEAIGKSGIVTQDIYKDGTGVIKLDGKEYIAADKEKGEIAKSSKVTVIDVKDDMVIVEKIRF